MSPDPHGKRFVVQPERDPHALVAQEKANRYTRLLLKEIDRLLAEVPAQLAPLIAAEQDQEKRKTILERSFRDVLREVDVTKEALLDKLFSTEH